MQEEEGEEQLCRGNTMDWDAIAQRMVEEVILWEVGEAIPDQKNRFLLVANSLLRCQSFLNPRKGWSRALRPGLFHWGTATNLLGNQTRGWHSQ